MISFEFKNKAFELYEKFILGAKTKYRNNHVNHINNINSIYFELSNICNYSAIHTKCPASIIKNKSVMDSNVYKNVISDLSKIDFEGFISFHRYNEPLMDPRLISFISYARHKIPKSKLRILTNGYYLTQEIADELVASGLSLLEVTAYFEHEFQRLKNIKITIPYHVFMQNLDGRIDVTPCN